MADMLRVCVLQRRDTWRFVLVEELPRMADMLRVCVLHRRDTWRFVLVLACRPHMYTVA